MYILSLIGLVSRIIETSRLNAPVYDGSRPNIDRQTIQLEFYRIVMMCGHMRKITIAKILQVYNYG